MKKLLLVLFITAMGMFEGHSQALVQTYTDRCTGQVSVFSVPMNGSAAVAFYNRSRVFTAQEFQNGTLQAWLEETYLWWTALSPCSSSTTGAQATQQTTQQTTQNATQAATNAAQSTTNVTTNASPPPTSTPPPTQTSQSTTQNTTAPDTTTSQPDTTSTGPDTTSSGNNTTASGGSGTDTSNQQTETSTDQSTTNETNSTENTTQESSSSESQESTGGDTGNEGSTEESTEVENTSEESTTEESTTEESSTEESTEETSSEESSESEETSNEETDESTDEETTEESSEEESTEEESSEEEQSEEESDESSEEDSEEEETEEESESDEDEESEEEDSEEESNNEDEEEDDKKKKKKRNLAPPIVMANVLSQQMPDGTYSQAAMFGVSQSSLMGTETYGLNVMVYDNLKQFMVNANFSKVHINEEGRANRVYSASIGGMKMFTTLMGMMNHSMVWMGKKGSVAGVAFGTTVTTNNVDVIDGNIYFDNQFLGLSLTSFYTKPFNFDRLTVSPMLAVSSPFMMFDMYNHNTMWNKNVMIIAGSNFSYKLTQRFGVNIGVNIIESSANDFTTMKTFTIGGRLSF